MTQQYPTQPLSTSDAAAGATVVETNVINPTDRVRWPAVIAGLFAALSTLALLGVLGTAIGLSAYDAGDRARNFGIGAGVWGILSALIAFGFGGWLAARAAAARGRNNGLLNGAMVWAVAIPLTAYMLAGGAARVADTATRAAGDAAQAAATDQANSADGQSVLDQAQTASARISGDAQASMSDPQTRERAAETASRGAWATLVALLLALAASALGGYLGARDTHDRDGRRLATA